MLFLGGSVRLICVDENCGFSGITSFPFERWTNPANCGGNRFAFWVA